MSGEPVDSPWPDAGGTWSRPPPPFPARPSRRRRLRLTWDEAYGLLLGAAAFGVAFSHAAPGRPAWVAGAFIGAAGLAGIAVSAFDGGRSDWWARLIWSLGCLGLGLMSASSAGLSPLAASPLLAAQTLAAFAVLNALRRRQYVARATAVVAAAAPSALLGLLVLGAAPAHGWIADGYQALTVGMFGLARVARRPRGVRIIGRT